MTPQDHNKTLAIVYAIIGVLALTGLTIIILKHVNRILSAQSGSLPTGQYVYLPSTIKAIGPYLAILLPPMLQLITAYGLFTRKWWGRIIALIFSALLFWLFPLGTGLAIYTWWFLLSERGRLLYL